MASTNKTPHLGLCQWEATDPFLREDMNGDFAKIDAAIGRLNETIAGLSHKKLFDITVDQQVISMEIDFAEIDLSQFAELSVYILFRSSGNKYMRVNGVSENKYASSASTPDKMWLNNAAYQLVFGSDGMYLRSKTTTTGYSMSKADFPQLNTLEIFGTSSSAGLNLGDRITVWGVRR